MPILPGIDIDEYHASDRVSATKLRVFTERGPRAYYERYVARTHTREDTDALAFGRAFEDALLAPKAFAERYAVRPEGLDLRTKEGKAWVASQGDKPILRADEHHVIGRMIDNVLRHSVARMAVEGMAQQLTLTSDFPDLPGIQARPDLCDLEGPAWNGWTPTTIDIKTCDDLGQFARKAFTYGYHVQAALCGTVLRGNGIEGASHWLLACEKSWPYRVQLLRLSDEALLVGEREVLSGLGKLATCYLTQTWRLVPEEIDLLEPPAWLVRAHTREPEE